MSKAVFSNRFVVASMSANTLASAAYGTLMNARQLKAGSIRVQTYGSPAFQPPGRSTSLVFDRAASALKAHQSVE